MLKLSVIGNLGSDPELKYSQNGSPYLRCNVAGNYRTRGQDGAWADQTEWVRVTVFGQRADTLAQHLKKGMRVYVEGRLEARPWTDQQGNVRAGLEITADTVEFMTARRDDDEPMTPPKTVNRQPQQGQTPDPTPGGYLYRDASAQGQDDDDLEGLPF